MYDRWRSPRWPGSSCMLGTAGQLWARKLVTGSRPDTFMLAVLLRHISYAGCFAIGNDGDRQDRRATVSEETDAATYGIHLRPILGRANSASREILWSLPASAAAPPWEHSPGARSAKPMPLALQTP